ncbi:unnamed protein product [Durusdinium trenchii]|uniref:Uncharacterized protein n=1 Tax=Durusdinium trenchii TaxID=1381693 RepID=A0ABP0RP96_9DINO
MHSFPLEFLGIGLDVGLVEGRSHRCKPASWEEASRGFPEAFEEASQRLLKRLPEAFEASRGFCASSLADLPTPPKSRLRLEATDVAHGAGADGADRKELSCAMVHQQPKSGNTDSSRCDSQAAH